MKRKRERDGREEEGEEEGLLRQRERRQAAADKDDVTYKLGKSNGDQVVPEQGRGVISDSSDSSSPSDEASVLSRSPVTGQSVLVEVSKYLVSKKAAAVAPKQKLWSQEMAGARGGGEYLEKDGRWVRIAPSDTPPKSQSPTHYDAPSIIRQ